MPLTIELLLDATDEECDELQRSIEQVLGDREEILVVRIEEREKVWTLTVSTGDLRRELPLFPEEHKPELFKRVLEDLVHNLGTEPAM